jgi:asparagine synthase (glutamine-hydrolysing)
MDSRIFDRPKAGFVLPIERWARQQLEAEMDEVFRDEALADRVGLDGDTVLKLWRSFVRGHAGLYWSRVWAIYVLMKWTRIHGASLPSESMP